MAFQFIKSEIVDGVAFIRLNDPETLNALRPQMAYELRCALDDARGCARALVIAGEGRAFCSGAKLTDDAHAGPSSWHQAGSGLENDYHPLLRELAELPFPFITAVRGAAAGLGASLALVADLIVAGEGAFFLEAFRKVGLVPDGGASYLLSRAVGRVRAMEMMLLGERISAAKALDWGLINRVVPDEEVTEAALAIGRELAAGPTHALGLIRKLAWQALDASWIEQLHAERIAQREAYTGLEFQEGRAAFREKRPPRFFHPD